MRIAASKPFLPWPITITLVAADPEAAVGQRLRARRIKRDPLAARVEHDKIVAQTVHFQESRHRRLYRRLSTPPPVRSRRRYVPSVRAASCGMERR
ncbi:MAG: hypothetical protein WDM89_16175 [Rhizomicrobium sp.]